MKKNFYFHNEGLKMRIRVASCINRGFALARKSYSVATDGLNSLVFNSEYTRKSHLIAIIYSSLRALEWPIAGRSQ